MLKAYSRAVARINSLRTEEEGATAAEYGLIIAPHRRRHHRWSDGAGSSHSLRIFNEIASGCSEPQRSALAARPRSITGVRGGR